MKKKSSHKKATSAQRQAKKKPVAGRITKSARKPVAVKFGQTAGVKALKGNQKNQTKPKAVMKTVDVFACPPRTGGFMLENSWDGLFDLYSLDGKRRAIFSVELQKIYTLALRGHAKTDVTAFRLENALSLLGHAYLADQAINNDGWQSGTWRLVGESILTDLTVTLGRSIARLEHSSSVTGAENEAFRLVAMFNKAADGMVKSRFPRKARGSAKGKECPREVSAILAAKGLCELKGRLPSKIEVRAQLEKEGFVYAQNKDLNARWRILFERSGLERLPEILT
jgi:hypothetical protein